MFAPQSNRNLSSCQGRPTGSNYLPRRPASVLSSVKVCATTTTNSSSDQISSTPPVQQPLQSPTTSGSRIYNQEEHDMNVNTVTDMSINVKKLTPKIIGEFL